MTIEMIDKWVTSLRFNEIKNETKYLCWFLIDFIFCRLYCLGVSISHVIFSEVTLVWGVGAVAILDCSLNVYACGRQKALTIPAYCVAANCNNSQATQSITRHEFPRNRPAVRRKWVNLYNSNELCCCASVTPICVASTSLSAIS